MVSLAIAFDNSLTCLQFLVLGVSGLCGQTAIPSVVSKDQENATALLLNTMGQNALAKPAMNSHATETRLAKVSDKEFHIGTILIA